jgi:hypothetical protein
MEVLQQPSTLTMTQPPSNTPDPQTRRKKIQCKQELIVSSLQRFYSTRPDLPELVKLLQGTSEISLRLVDWFVTNYSKTHSTSYILNGQEFVVYMNYKNQLKAYSKKLFDPFCRRERIQFQIPGHEAFITTVGKLNFFRWAIEKDILTYIKLHQPEIEKEMNAAMREQAKSRSTTTTPSNSSNTTSRDSQMSSVTVMSAVSAVSSASSQTRKRQSSKTSAGGGPAAACKLLQKHDCPIEMRWD